MRIAIPKVVEAIKAMPLQVAECLMDWLRSCCNNV